MIHQCIICGKPVIVIGSPEIVACDDDNCIRTVENHISLHYQSETILKPYNPRNDFDDSVCNQITFGL